MSTLKVNALQDTSGKGFYPARAWINFNGWGTISIRDDANFSSLTDHGTGDYSATYTNSFPNTNYAPVVSCKELDSTATTTVVPYIGANQTLANSIQTSALRFGTLAGQSRYDSVVVTAHVTN